MIEVRPARPGDGVALLQMTRVLAEHHNMLHRVTAKAEDYERHLFCEHPIIGALIAEKDSVAAGAVVWHRSFTTNGAREIIYLEDITVLPEHRSKGVGKALMKALAQLAINRGTPAVFWMAMGWNEKATRFYQTLGAEVEPNAVFCQIRDEALQRLADS